MSGVKSKKISVIPSDVEEKERYVPANFLPHHQGIDKESSLSTASESSKLKSVRQLPGGKSLIRSHFQLVGVSHAIHPPEDHVSPFSSRLPKTVLEKREEEFKSEVDRRRAEKEEMQKKKKKDMAKQEKARHERLEAMSKMHVISLEETARKEFALEEGARGSTARGRSRGMEFVVTESLAKLHRHAREDREMKTRITSGLDHLVTFGGPKTARDRLEHVGGNSFDFARPKTSSVSHRRQPSDSTTMMMEVSSIDGIAGVGEREREREDEGDKEEPGVQKKKAQRWKTQLEKAPPSVVAEFQTTTEVSSTSTSISSTRPIGARIETQGKLVSTADGSDSHFGEAKRNTVVGIGKKGEDTDFDAVSDEENGDIAQPSLMTGLKGVGLKVKSEKKERTLKARPKGERSASASFRQHPSSSDSEKGIPVLDFSAIRAEIKTKRPQTMGSHRRQRGPPPPTSEGPSATISASSSSTKPTRPRGSWTSRHDADLSFSSQHHPSGRERKISSTSSRPRTDAPHASPGSPHGDGSFVSAWTQEGHEKAVPAFGKSSSSSGAFTDRSSYPSVRSSIFDDQHLLYRMGEEAQPFGLVAGKPSRGREHGRLVPSSFMPGSRPPGRGKKLARKGKQQESSSLELKDIERNLSDVDGGDADEMGREEEEEVRKEPSSEEETLTSKSQPEVSKKLTRPVRRTSSKSSSTSKLTLSPFAEVKKQRKKRVRMSRATNDVKGSKEGLTGKAQDMQFEMHGHSPKRFHEAGGIFEDIRQHQASFMNPKSPFFAALSGVRHKMEGDGGLENVRTMLENLVSNPDGSGPVDEAVLTTLLSRIHHKQDEKRREVMTGDDKLLKGVEAIDAAVGRTMVDRGDESDDNHDNEHFRSVLEENFGKIRDEIGEFDSEEARARMLAGDVSDDDIPSEDEDPSMSDVSPATTRTGTSGRPSKLSSPQAHTYRQDEGGLETSPRSSDRIEKRKSGDGIASGPLPSSSSTSSSVSPRVAFRISGPASTSSTSAAPSTSTSTSTTKSKPMSPPSLKGTTKPLSSGVHHSPYETLRAVSEKKMDEVTTRAVLEGRPEDWSSWGSQPGRSVGGVVASQDGSSTSREKERKEEFGESIRSFLWKTQEEPSADVRMPHPPMFPGKPSPGRRYAAGGGGGGGRGNLWTAPDRAKEMLLQVSSREPDAATISGGVFDDLFRQRRKPRKSRGRTREVKRIWAPIVSHHDRKDGERETPRSYQTLVDSYRSFVRYGVLDIPHAEHGMPSAGPQRKRRPSGASPSRGMRPGTLSPSADYQVGYEKQRPKKKNLKVIPTSSSHH